MALKYCICVVVGGTAVDEASESGSDVGDADATADKDGLLPGTAFLSKLHIVTHKVITTTRMSVASAGPYTNNVHLAADR